MKKYAPIIIGVLGIKLIIQLLGNKNYGFHRDELLHLSVGEHLDWGYMEFPPLIGWIGRFATTLFGYSLSGVRLFSTLAGIGVFICCFLLVKEFGGKKVAVFVAGMGGLAFLPFYRSHTLFQPVPFDQVFWIAGFYFLVRYINTSENKYLTFTGIILGFGMLNKFTMLFWAFGVVVGLIFYNKGSLFRNKWLYLSGLLGFMICLPNLLWQFSNDFPVLQHLQALQENQLGEISKLQFWFDQLEFPMPFLLSVLGVYGLWNNERLVRFKWMVVTSMVIFLTLWVFRSKSYYVFALYPLLFAAGGVQVEKIFQKKPIWGYLSGIFILIPSLYFIPQATPVLPIEKYISYMGLSENQDRYEFTGDYADMFGWEEQVRLVDSVYQSLDQHEKGQCVIWAENYGEAGAVTILGKNYGLPHPISRHGTFWTWGFGNKDALVWISLGNEDSSVRNVFEDVTLVNMIYHPYAIGEENGIPLYICRNPRIDIAAWWESYRQHVFD